MEGWCSLGSVKPQIICGNTLIGQLCCDFKDTFSLQRKISPPFRPTSPEKNRILKKKSGLTIEI